MSTSSSSIPFTFYIVRLDDNHPDKAPRLYEIKGILWGPNKVRFAERLMILGCRNTVPREELFDSPEAAWDAHVKLTESVVLKIEGQLAVARREATQARLGRDLGLPTARIVAGDYRGKKSKDS